MEKKVYCLIGERCKCIKYTVNEQVSDVNMIRRCLDEARRNDHILDMMLFNKYIVLQKRDIDRNNQFCDIEEDDVVENKSDVRVVLITIDESTLTNYIPSNSSTSIEIYEGGEVNENEFKSDVIFVNDTTDVPHVQEDSTSVEANEDLNKSEVIFIDNTADITPVQKDINPPSLDTEPVLSRKKSYIKKKSFRSLVSLPPLTLDLHYKIKEEGITRKNRKYFIAHWGSYLWNVTNKNPKPIDYYKLSEKIIENYPSFDIGEESYNSLRNLLSSWIRNRRRNIKKAIINEKERRRRMQYLISNEDYETSIQVELKKL
ncbi:uncharacterized protein LOC113384611 [Ctenocephalides felis]|uniref:uncharacterized protein LOC113384611 n=1 Tax=Ctenocephalides felis TaxID=7515 RepID=UPI000E6E17BF|nr:uncharacterized protein LOC113384611 [Ctenocephalides felis]